MHGQLTRQASDFPPAEVLLGNPKEPQPAIPTIRLRISVVRKNPFFPTAEFPILP